MDKAGNSDSQHDDRVVADNDNGVVEADGLPLDGGHVLPWVVDARNTLAHTKSFLATWSRTAEEHGDDGMGEEDIRRVDMPSLAVNVLEIAWFCCHPCVLEVSLRQRTRRAN